MSNIKGIDVSNNDGPMRAGWLLKNSKWYYLDETNDGITKAAWIVDNNKDYCLYSSGVMICNTNAYEYRFDSSGVATKLS